MKAICKKLCVVQYFKKRKQTPWDFAEEIHEVLYEKYGYLGEGAESVPRNIKS